MPFTRTVGPSLTASSRIRWLRAALLVSYASLPCFGTTALAELVSTMDARQILVSEYRLDSAGQQIITGDVHMKRCSPL